MAFQICMYTLVVLYGLVIGSFLNVLILRIPAGEDFVQTRSHCVKCGYQLTWFDMIPVFSYLALRGRCRKCGEKISPQYPIIEALNAVLYLIVFLCNGINFLSVIYCLVTSALIVISVIDERNHGDSTWSYYFYWCDGCDSCRNGLEAYFFIYCWNVLCRTVLRDSLCGFQWQMDWRRRCNLNDGCRFGSWLEECNRRIFPVMYHRFCGTYHSYEADRCRQSIISWTLSGSRCLYYDALWRQTGETGIWISQSYLLSLDSILVKKSTEDHVFCVAES